MKARGVTDTLNLALEASGCDKTTMQHKARLLSDNRASYVPGELADWLADKKMSHVRGAPYHPQTQGKIERWHQTLKNRVLLENYFLPVIWRCKFAHSSNIITTTGTTKASTT